MIPNQKNTFKTLQMIPNQQTNQQTMKSKKILKTPKNTTQNLPPKKTYIGT